MSGFRLSPQQRRIFQLDLGEIAGGRTQAVFRLEGRLDGDALARAAGGLVERHEILRTAFPQLAGLELPVQEPGDPWHVRIGGLDATDLDAPARQRRIEATRLEALSRHLDLTRPELLDLVLVEMDVDSSLLVWTQPALWGDGESVVALWSELLEEATGSAGRDEPIQYADISEWLNEILESEDAEDGLTYWRRRLSELREPGFPLAEQPGPAGGYRPRTTAVGLEPQRLARLDAWARSEGSSLETALEVLWATLLCRYADCERIPVATAFDGRSYAELEQAAGLFSEHLPIVVDPGLSPSLASAVRKLDTDLSEAAEWQEYFCSERIGGDRRPSAFGFDSSDLPRGSAGNVDWIAERLDTRLEPHLLALSLRRPQGAAAHAVSAELVSDASRISDSTARGIADAFVALVASAAEDPATALLDLSLVGAAPQSEQASRLAGAPEADPPATASVVESIAAQVEAAGEALAVVAPDEGLTYDELWNRAGALASRLIEDGVQNGSVVAVCCRRSTDMVVAILGTLRAGAAYLPLDPGYPRDRLDFMTADAGAELVVAHAATGDIADGLGIPVVRLEESASDDRDDRAAGDLAYVIYTSGSTGEPKGVAVTHRNLLYSTTARRRHYGEAPDRFLLLSSYAFDSSIVGLFWTLTTGSTLVLPAEGTEQDPGALAQTIEHHRITDTLCLPTLYALLLEQADVEQLSSLRQVIVAGEACPGALIARHFELRPQAELVNEYGPTEATVWATSARLRAEDAAGVPIGRSAPFSRVHLLDRRGRPLPPGVAGEIVIGGEGVARGYVGRPGLTAERFVPDPFSPDPGERLYRTGDRGRLRADGQLEFLGRLDHQVKIRGVRIEPEEIEARLAAHGDLLQSVVVPRPDDAGRLQLVAYVVRAADREPGVSELRSFLQQSLPESMIPAHFVFMDEIPLAPNGKVDRAALPDPGEARPDLEAAFVEPRGALEEYLAAQWRTVLQTDRVGVLDNFFELGGNSIQAAIFMNRLRGEIDDFVHVGRLFENPTVRSLADFLEREHPGAVAGLGDGGSGADRQRLDGASLDGLDDLSDEEVDSMLDELLSEEEGRRN